MKRPWFAMLLAVGCAEIREHTYPPDLHYVSKGEVRSAMLRLASGAVELDRALAPGGAADAEQNAKVLAALREMVDAAEGLDPGAARASHPQIERNLEAFRRAVAAAEEQARGTPPSYYLAGTIVGACTACHAAGK